MSKKLRLLFTKSKLKKIDKTIEGHLGLNEGVFLYKVAKLLNKNSVIVEIGAYKGKSTCFIVEGIGSKDIQFYTIDTWRNDAMEEKNRDVYPEFLHNIKPYRNKVKPLRGYSFEVRKSWPAERKIDFLWIDADHSYEGVKKDIEDWLPLVKKNSFVCFHDWRDFAGVKKAIDELIAEGIIKAVKTVGNIFVAKKR